MRKATPPVAVKKSRSHPAESRDSMTESMGSAKATAPDWIRT